MDWVRSKHQTKLYDSNARCSISIYRNLFWTRFKDANNNTARDHRRKCHKHNQYVLKLITLLTLGTASPSFATDVGGVSATANPIANSSGSVTNQAIQVLQGPYITNTYGGGIQCQGPTMNITPYANGTVSYKKPFEDIFLDQYIIMQIMMMIQYQIILVRYYMRFQQGQIKKIITPFH